MWDEAVLDDDGNIAGNLRCSDAVALEAAPSSATDDADVDITRRMALKPVNLYKATSAMGRGPITDDDDDGESENRRLNDAQIGKTSDRQRLEDHRGNHQ